MTTLARGFSFFVLSIFVSTAHSKPEVLSEAARVAKDAFYAIEANPWDTEKPITELGRIYKTSPTEPWVLIAVSRAILDQGYIKGDRSDLSSYQADKVQAALDFAKGAVEYGESHSMAHVAVARLQIITGNNRGAWEELNKAHQLDPQGFYPWYYRAVVSLKMRDNQRAVDALKEAETRATMPYQKEWVLGRMISVAKLTGNLAEQETYYKKAIAFNPDEATGYGNYALFLKTHKRYDEAIANYKKAIAIRPYGLAIEQLKQSEILRDAAKEQSKIFEADKAKRQ